MVSGVLLFSLCSVLNVEAQQDPCYGCSGDDPNNPYVLNGAPGRPGTPYEPDGGCGVDSIIGNGGPGGNAERNETPKLVDLRFSGQVVVKEWK